MRNNDLVLTIAELPAHTHGLSYGTTGNAGNTASNYQPGLVLREMLCLNGSDAAPDHAAASPFLGEMRGNLLQRPRQFLRSHVWPALSHHPNRALFSLIGTTYGGNGRSTFAIPDLRGRLDAATDGANLAPAPSSASLLQHKSRATGAARPLLGLRQLDRHPTPQGRQRFA